MTASAKGGWSTQMDDANFEVLLCRVAMIIDPEAFETHDDLTPTEREIWNDRRGKRQGTAGSKARKILKLFFSHEQSAAKEG